MNSDEPSLRESDGWVAIATAPLGRWGLLWNPVWRHTYPGMRNGDGASCWVDTCEPDAKGWQTWATHWRPPLEPPPQGDRAPGIGSALESAESDLIDEIHAAIRSNVRGWLFGVSGTQAAAMAVHALIFPERLLYIQHMAYQRAFERALSSAKQVVGEGSRDAIKDHIPPPPKIAEETGG